MNKIKYKEKKNKYEGNHPNIPYIIMRQQKLQYLRFLVAPKKKNPKINL